MPNRNLKLYSQQSNGRTYADPLRPAYTVRFKTVSANKAISGVSVPNYTTEVIVNDSFDVTPSAGNSGMDNLSVRLRVSGTSLSATRIAQMLAALTAGLATWPAEGVMVGFEPTTLPVNVI